MIILVYQSLVARLISFQIVVLMGSSEEKEMSTVSHLRLVSGLYLQDVVFDINCHFKEQIGESGYLFIFFLVSRFFFAAFVPEFQNYDNHLIFVFLVISAFYRYLYLDSCYLYQSFETQKKDMILHFSF